MENLKCGLLFCYLFIIFKINCEKNYILNLFFIDNEKGIPHFKFAPLEGIYLQKCKVTGNPTLLIAPCFCLKFGMSEIIDLDL